MIDILRVIIILVRLMKIIEISRLSKSYDKDNKKICAIKNISISFESRKFYAIMGHSGSGKSTLVKILGLMEKYDSGVYILNDNDVASLNDFEKAHYRMKEIGFIFQDFYLDKNMTAKENLILPMLINKDIEKNNREVIACDLLKKVNLLDRSNHFPTEMSGGEQQRVCIARSLVNNPKIILADEPTGNLDENNEKIIFEYLKNLSKEGKCVIVVSHSEEVKKYADVIIKLKEGELDL